jgi:hypothetical protein
MLVFNRLLMHSENAGGLADAAGTHPRLTIFGK